MAKNKACIHGLQKGHCRNCGARHFCEHNKHRSHCRICRPIGWAKGCLSVFKGSAKRRGYTPPNITAENFVKLMLKSKRCFGCDSRLDWENTSPHLHHNHATGEVLGFCHSLCNQAEGMLSKMTSQERLNFITTFFCEIFE